MANYYFAAYCNMLADKGRIDGSSKALRNAVSDGCAVSALGSERVSFHVLRSGMEAAAAWMPREYVFKKAHQRRS